MLDAQNEAQADEALIAFIEAGANAGAGADQSATAAWAARHPAHNADRARCAAAAWAGEPIGAWAPLPPMPVGTEAVAVERVRAIGRATAQAFRAALAPTVSAVPVAATAAATAAPLTSLVAAARARGLAPADLAARLQLPYGLFFKLQRRLIAAETVPAALVAQMADALGRAADDIAAYLRLPPMLAAGASYRADDTPQAGAQERFADALQTDPEATDAQRTLHLGVAPNDGT